MIDDNVRLPGEFIRQELELRNWTQEDLAKVVGKPTPQLNRIIRGKVSITAETAVLLGVAFETSPEIWMERDMAYKLSLTNRNLPEVQRRSGFYKIAPVKDMERRGLDSANQLS